MPGLASRRNRRPRPGLAILATAIAAGNPGAQEFRTAANAYTHLTQIEKQELHGKSAAEHANRAVELMRKYQAASAIGAVEGPDRGSGPVVGANVLAGL